MMMENRNNIDVDAGVYDSTYNYELKKYVFLEIIILQNP